MDENLLLAEKVVLSNCRTIIIIVFEEHLPVN